MSLQRVRGSIWDTSDNLVVNTFAELPTADREGIIFVSGATVPNDGKGGWFRWNMSIDRSTADGSDVIDPTGSGVGKGCWIRQQFITAPAGSSFSEIQTAKANQDVFTLQTFVYTPGQGQLAVYVNGTRLTRFSFTETTPNTVTLAHPLRLGDIIEFIKYEQPVGQQGQTIDALQVQYDDTRTVMGATEVQSAIETLYQQLGVATGGNLPTASRIPFVNKLPNPGTTVQSAVDWMQLEFLNHKNAPNAHLARVIDYDNTISQMRATNVQAALDELKTIIGHGLATDIEFDSTQLANLSANNVQSALEQLHDYAQGTNDELQVHEQAQSNAHDATAIYFDGDHSNVAWYAGIYNVEEALKAAGVRLDNHSHEAKDIHVDDSVLPIGASSQAAHELAYNNLQAHIKSTTAHKAIDLPFQASQRNLISAKLQQRLMAANVQTAIDALEELYLDHKNEIDAHEAHQVAFMPQMGIQATNVEQALLYINQGNWRYQGHLDLTSPAPTTRSNAVNDFWTVPFTGQVDNSWIQMNLFDSRGMPPADPNNPGVYLVNGDAYVFQSNDGKLWYMDMPSPILSEVVRTRPGPGISQSIEAAQVGDIPLTLVTQTFRTAQQQAIPRTFTDIGLWVIGDAWITQHLQVDTAEDKDGNLRQSAGEVLFATTPNIAGNTVQTAVQGVSDRIEGHISGQGPRHEATQIIFRKTTEIPVHDVQAAVVRVQNNLENHRAANSAHPAAKISYNNANSGLQAQNVQAAIDELNTGAAGHPMDPQAHRANQIVFAPGGNLVNSGDVQAALLEMDALLSAHEAAPDAHEADNLLAQPFTGTGTATVQVLLDQLDQRIIQHADRNKQGAHLAKNIGFDNSSANLTGTPGTVQEALEAVTAMANLTDIDGGTF